MINNEKRKIETYFDMEKTGKALKQDLKVFQTLSITVSMFVLSYQHLK